MSASLSSLRDTVREEMKVDPKGVVWGNTVLNRYIKQAHRKLQKDMQFRFPQNEQRASSDVSPDGTNIEFDVSSFAIGSIEIVKFINGETSGPLTFTNKPRLLESSDLDVAGNPSKYYLRNTYIGFDLIPPSGSTVKIWHTILVTAPTEDAESDLPNTDEVNTAIAEWAKYLAWKSPKGQRDEAAAAKETYGEILQELRYEYWIEVENMQFNTQRDVNLGGSHSARHDTIC